MLALEIFHGDHGDGCVGFLREIRGELLSMLVSAIRNDNDDAGFGPRQRRDHRSGHTTGSEDHGPSVGRDVPREKLEGGGDIGVVTGEGAIWGDPPGPRGQLPVPSLLMARSFLRENDDGDNWVLAFSCCPVCQTQVQLIIP